jgi:geranylgeranyl pyrophosphate synthase
MPGASNERLAALQASLRTDLRDLLAHAQATHAWGADACVALCAPGKLLAQIGPSTRVPAGFWALLPLTIFTYISGSSADPARARRLSIACELLLCALDYFDEIEDGDESEARRVLGDGRLLNCSTAIYQVALQLLAELDATAPRPSSEREIRLSDVACEELLFAMHGQHLDLLAEQRPWQQFTQEECVAIAEAKAGALCRMVCRLAAVSAAALDLVELFAQVGTHVGIAAQIENDAHDLEEIASQAGGPQPSGKSDLARAKKTLPVVIASQLALQNTDTSADSQVHGGQEPAWPAQVYLDAVQAALGSAVYHRLSASALVEQIEQVRGKDFPPELRLLLGIDAL